MTGAELLARCGPDGGRSLQEAVASLVGDPERLQSVTGAVSVRVSQPGPGALRLAFWLGDDDRPCELDVVVRARV